VIRLEQAKTTRVDLAVLEKLAGALGVSVGAPIREKNSHQGKAGTLNRSDQCQL
jgi:hypothetical protein